MSRRCLVTMLVVGLASGGVALLGAPRPGQLAAAASFVVITENQPTADYTAAFERVMTCPAHRHGDPASARAELIANRDALAGRKLACCWVCRTRLHETLPWVAELVDQVIVNPFIYTHAEGPVDGDAVWPSWDHPVLNELRFIRQQTGPKRLLACVDLRGEPLLFHRPASVEEAEWMLCAVVGSDYDGIVVRERNSEHDREGAQGNSLGENPRIRALLGNLRAHSRELAAAEPVAWVSASNRGVPLAGLRHGNTLFVVLLHPALMKAERPKPMPLPLLAEPAEGELLVVPDRVRVANARMLCGLRVESVTDASGACRVPFSFETGGQILLFDLQTGAEP